jgi:Zn-finger nucleic acid-binding protein
MYRASSPVTACPRCQRALEERDVPGDTILACPACGGVWLDPEQARVVFERRRGEESFVRGSEDIAHFSHGRRSPTDGVAICPIGGEEMTLCEAEGIRIDRCAEHGTWFDAHELGLIVKSADAPSAVTMWLSGLFSRKNDDE